MGRALLQLAVVAYVAVMVVAVRVEHATALRFRMAVSALTANAILVS
jgi:hypothetical protein